MQGRTVGRGCPGVRTLPRHFQLCLNERSEQTGYRTTNVMQHDHVYAVLLNLLNTVYENEYLKFVAILIIT